MRRLTAVPEADSADLILTAQTLVIFLETFSVTSLAAAEEAAEKAMVR